MLIKIISPGPAFFKQERVGYMGRTFTMLKFRSMRVGNCTNAHREYLTGLIRSEKHSDGNFKKPMTKRDNLNSLIPYGKVFRRLCLDELPQLINVIRGEMSLIGPRPPITYEVEEYQRWHNGRFDTLPGITGLWQVNGKNRLTFEQMVRLDIRYSRQESLWVDIIIILKTPFAIISNALYHKQEEKKIVKGTYKYA
jgi:lipopolysaccharide/colanic/teichoic acid biosynthesis glycosyltransferase